MGADPALSKTFTPTAPAPATKFRVVACDVLVAAIAADGSQSGGTTLHFEAASGQKLAAVVGGFASVEDAAGGAATGAAILAAVQTALGGKL